MLLIFACMHERDMMCCPNAHDIIDYKCNVVIWTQKEQIFLLQPLSFTSFNTSFYNLSYHFYDFNYANNE